MLSAILTRLAAIIVIMMIVAAATACLAESMSLDIDQLQWESGRLLPAYCEIPIKLDGPVASIQRVTLRVKGAPREGSMTLCNGGCDSFPCHQTLLAYFKGGRFINSWVPLEGSATGYDFEATLQYAECYPDCYHPCTGQDISQASWKFLKEDGAATLRLELRGDLAGCGARCVAENGIQQVTVKVDYVPLDGPELAAWGAMKAVFR